MLISPSIQFLLGQNKFHTQQNKLVTHQLIFGVITYKTKLYLHLIVLAITFYVTSKNLSFAITLNLTLIVTGLDSCTA